MSTRHNKFTVELRNRLTMPTTNVIVVEDDLNCQNEWTSFLLSRYGHQGLIVPHIIGNAIDACLLIHSMIQHNRPIGWIAIDHDLQYGNGYELIQAIRDSNIPILLSSGIQSNNDRMNTLGITYPVIRGKANDPHLTEYLNIIEGIK